MSEHLGYDQHDAAGRKGGNSGHSTRSETVSTEVGPVRMEMPVTGRAASSRRRAQVPAAAGRGGGDGDLAGGTGVITAEISAHLAGVCGAEVSRDTISKITDVVLE